MQDVMKGDRCKKCTRRKKHRVFKHRPQEYRNMQKKIIQ